MVKRMADRPIILAMANPEPEIRPELAKAARPDCLVGTGRSDYPNQVNNSLCFPFIFRGALDCGATKINEEMKLAATRALAALARAEPSDIVALAYGEATPPFGPDYLIPRAFDPRLITTIAPAVARAAMDSGVATRPIEDFGKYHDQLSRFVYESGVDDGAGIRRREEIAQARRVCGRRGRARAARGAGRGGRGPRPARARRPHRHHREPHPEARASPDARQGLRRRQHPRRPALSRLLERVLQARQAQGRHAPAGAGGHAHAAHAGRGDARAPGRRGRDAVRHRQQLAGAPALRPAGDRRARRCEDDGRDADADPARPAAVHLRHARQSRSLRRGNCRDDAARRRGSAALRREAERRAPVAFELRQLRCAVGGEDARSAGD